MKNSERYKSVKERLDAFRNLCNRCGTLMEVSGFAQWLDLEADEEKPMPCFYCGGNVNVYDYNRVGHTVKFICDKCGAELSLNVNKADAVAAHNRVCKAVAEYKKGEVK